VPPHGSPDTASRRARGPSVSAERWKVRDQERSRCPHRELRADCTESSQSVAGHHRRKRARPRRMSRASGRVAVQRTHAPVLRCTPWLDGGIPWASRWPVQAPVASPRGRPPLTQPAALVATSN